MRKSLVRLNRQSHRLHSRLSHTSPPRLPKASVPRPTEDSTAKWIMQARDIRLLEREKRDGGGNEQQGGIYYRKHYVGPLVEVTPELIAFLQSLTDVADFMEQMDQKKVPPEVMQVLRTPDLVRRCGRILSTVHPHLARRVLTISHAVGVRHIMRTYEAIGFRMMSEGHWEEVLLLRDICRRQEGHVSVKLTDMVIRSLTETHQYTRLPSILPMIRKDGKKPSRQTFYLLVVAYLRNHDVSSARACLKEMEDNGFHLDGRIAAIIAIAYCPLGFNAEVEDRAIKALPELSMTRRTATLNSLISARLRSTDIKGARRLMSMFHMGSLRGKQRDKTLPLVTIRPNTHTFAMLMQHLSKRGDFARAADYFHAITQSGLCHDATSLLALVRLYVASGRITEAISTVERISQNSLGGATNELWCSLRKLCPQTSESQQTTIIEDFRGVELTPEIFSELLKGVLPLKHGSHCSILIAQIMRKHHIKPNPGTTVALAKFVDRSNGSRGTKHPVTLSGSVAYFNTKFNGPLSLNIVNKAIAAKLRFWKHLLDVRFRYGRKRSRMVHAGPHILPPGPIVDIPLSRDLATRPLRAMVADLRKRGILPDSESYLNRIRYDAIIAGDIESAKRVMHEMQLRGIAANQYHYAALMEGYVYTSDISGAQALFKEAMDAGLIQSPVLFTVLMKGYALSNHPNAAVEVLRLMEGAGIKPDAVAAMTLSTAFGRARTKKGRGLWKIAREVLLRLYPMVKHLPAKAGAKETHRVLHELVHPSAVHSDYTRPFAHGMDVNDLRSWKAELNALVEALPGKKSPALDIDDLFWKKQFPLRSREHPTPFPQKRLSFAMEVGAPSLPSSQVERPVSANDRTDCPVVDVAIKGA